MTTSDDDGTAERLALARAQRQHLGRLRTAERRDAAHERAAEAATEREAETEFSYNPPTAPANSSADTRVLLLAEQAALELDRAGPVAYHDVEGIEMEL